MGNISATCRKTINNINNPNLQANISDKNANNNTNNLDVQASEIGKEANNKLIYKLV